MSRPLGCLRDPIGCGRGEPIGLLVPVSAPGRGIPDAFTLRPFVERIADQAGQSCVGHALAQALRTRAAVVGRHLDPSAMAIYAVARELERPGVATLKDGGSYPAQAIEGLSDWGVVARTRWPDESPGDAPVPVDVLEAGSLAYVTGEYRIDTDRRESIKRAISAGYPVFFAMTVDASYMNYTGGLWDGMTGEPRGGHAQCIVGYDAMGVIVANSWGIGWGDAGFSHISWAAATGANAFDFYIITVSPTEAL